MREKEKTIGANKVKVGERIERCEIELGSDGDTGYRGKWIKWKREVSNRSEWERKVSLLGKWKIRLREREREQKLRLTFINAMIFFSLGLFYPSFFLWRKLSLKLFSNLADNETWMVVESFLVGFEVIVHVPWSSSALGFNSWKWSLMCLDLNWIPFWFHLHPMR